MEIEINFRLDEDGRTSNTKIQSGRRKDDHENTDNDENGPFDGPDQPPSSVVLIDDTDTKTSIDYDMKVTMTNLRQELFLSSVPSSSLFKDDDDDDDDDDDSSNNDDDDEQKCRQQQQQSSLWDDLLLDCEITDCGLMPRTFWIPAVGMEPRFTLEQFALDIFYHHVSSTVLTRHHHDMMVSGAEWWCQLRPSPEKTGRYSMHCPSSADDDDDDDDDDPATTTTTTTEGRVDPFQQGVSMHVDKDEELRILTGGTTYIHPHLSTVTYLTDLGSPTLIVDCRVEPFTGRWIVPQSSHNNNSNDDRVRGFISWPSIGKHTSFDGRYLHASPTDLMEDGMLQRQFQYTPQRLPTGNDKDNERWNKVQKRRHRRVTFLVNIWLNYRPLDVHPFPDTMVDKMSGRDGSSRRRLQFFTSSLSSPSSHDRHHPLHTRTVIVKSDMATELSDVFTDSNDDKNTTTTTSGSERNGIETQVVSYPTETLTWALGNHKSKEKLIVNVPLQSIRQEATNGGNVKVEWDRGALCSTGMDGKNDDDDNGCCFRLYVDTDQYNRQEETQNITVDDDAVVVSSNNNKRGIDGKDNSSSTGPVTAADEANKHRRVE